MHQPPTMPFIPGYFYYISIVLQAICVIHCLRKGNQQKWLWIIIIVPYIGCVAYFFSEIINGNDLRQAQFNLSAVINPTGSIRKLEQQLKFSDTFLNRLALADAYLANAQTDKAIELYESSHTGLFTENEHLLSSMIIAYFRKGRYEDIFPLAEKLSKTPQYARSQAHLLYAMALGNAGRLEQAEKEFKSMCSKFSCFEQRYQYGIFLHKTGRTTEAENLFNEMLNEAGHLGPREKRDNRQWLSLAKEALRNREA